MLKIDARIPVCLGDVSAGDAVLVAGDGPVPPGHDAERFDVAGPAHVAGCSCCGGRSPAALALDRLFQRRARGEIGFFRRVTLITAETGAELQVRAAVHDDPVAAARYRLLD